MMRTSRGRLRSGPARAAAGVTTAAALVLSGLAAATPARAQGEVPILGQALTVSSDDTPQTTRDVLISLHGVRRVEGATMVYFSVGYTPQSDAGSDNLSLMKAFGFQAQMTPLRDEIDAMGDVAILDIDGRKAYSTLYTGADHTDRGASECVCFSWLDALPKEPEPGKAYVGAAAVGPLPTSLDRVTVRVAGQFFSDVPVEDGPMEPTVTPDDPILVGTGWPEVDTKAITSVPDPSVFTLALTSHQATDDSAINERVGSDTRSLDLSADVLFDVDEATLTSKAKQEIAAAAKAIKGADVSGTITVIGHTDSSGSDSHNQDLSERRAESVAKALKPLLPSGITLTTDGKGESEPIASNETEDGKALNRRVTITLPEAK